ncbi:MAG: translocation/assembly module TamB [Ectothiorhodospiraceae bacterium]|nr:translocation/assembly module TamB [Ectothiorhodospiraceae bacterium]
MKRLLRALRLLWLTLVLLVGKTLRVTYIVAITLLAVLGWLLFTTSGADWLAQRAMDEEPRLQLEVTGGNLWSGLDVRDLRWRDEGIDVALDETVLRWNLLCLHALRVCLQEVGTQGARVRVDTQRLPMDEDPDPPEINLPLTILFPDVRLDDVQLEVDGHRAGWDTVAVAGSFGGSSLKLDRVRWAGLVAEPLMPAEQDEPEPTVAVDGEPLNIAELLNPDQRQAIELPEVSLPLDIAIRDFLLTDARLILPDREEALDRLALSADAAGDSIRLHTLELEHTQLTLRADGSIRLSGDYPLDLDVEVSVRDIPDVGTVSASLQAWNSVADAEIRLLVEGPARLTAEGQLAALDPRLPASLHVEWSGAGWPLTGEPDYRSPEGSLRFEGDLHDYRFDLAILLDGRDIPDGSIRARGNANYASAELEQLLVEALGGRLDSSGSVSWDRVIRWDARLAIDGIDVSSLHPEAPHRLDGDIRTEGALDDGALTLDLRVDRLRAAVREEILNLDGDIAHRPERGWLLSDVELRSGSSRVRVSGSVHDQLDLRGELLVAELADYLADAGGRLEGAFQVLGPMESPDARVSLEGRELRYLPVGTLDAISLEADVRQLAEASSSVELRLSGFEASEGDLEVGQITATLRGTRGAHTLELAVGEALLEAVLEARGGLGEDFGWNGELRSAALDGAGMSWTLEQPLPISYRPEPLEVRLAAHCWRYESARLCAEQDIVAGATSGSAGLSLRGYELDWLNPWLPDDIRLQGSILADVAVRWGETPLPQVSLDLGVEGGSVLLLDPDDREEVLTLDYETLALQLLLDEDRLDVGFELLSRELGQAEVDASVGISPQGQLGELDGSVRIADIRLSVLAPFFPEIRTLEGELAAEAQLGGSATDPNVNGQISLRSGVVETLALPVTISDINIALDIAGSQATLSGGFRSGAGEAEISGDADWSGESWQLALALTGDRLDVAYEDMVALRVSPDLRLRVRPRDVRLTGTLRVPSGDITIQQLPEGAVRVSRDVVIVDEEEDPDEPFSPDDLPTPEGWAVSTDIEVILGNRVNLTGYGLTARLEGAMRVRQADGGVLQGNGEIRIEDGRYRAYGQRLTIREGQFLFSGPIDAPEMYVEAIRTINRTERTGEQRTVIAGLRLEGRPEEPRVSLFSEPAMAEDDILSYIVLGRPVGESGPDGGNLMARAALSLGIAGGGGFVTSVAEDLGVEEFQIDTEGEGDDTQFVVSGYLGPNLYVSYGVGVFQPTNEITLRYRLATNLFLQAVAGLESALDLLYSFEF